MYDPDYSAKISSLEDEYSGIHAEMMSSADRFDKESAELQDAIKKTEILEGKVESIPEDITLAKKKKDTMSRKIVKLEEHLSTIKGESRDAVNALQQQVRYYERLGLRFVRVENGSSLKIVFTQIDAKNPKSEFVAGLQINDEDKYEITECEPKIEKLNRMVDELNTSNDFTTFIRGVRGAFKATCL